MRIKRPHEFLTEAKSISVGSIYGVNTVDNLGALGTRKITKEKKIMRRGYVSTNDVVKNVSGWFTFKPEFYGSKVPSEPPYFYIQIEKSGAKWAEGKLVFAGLLSNPDIYNYTSFRVDVNSLVKPGPEFGILMKDSAKDYINKEYHVDGKESGLNNLKGESASVKEGEYVIVGQDFQQTSKSGEPVFLFSRKSNPEEYFTASVSTIKEFSTKLNDDQLEVICEWFRKELGGANIEYRSSVRKFRIFTWKIVCNKQEGFPFNFNAGPFVSKSQAEKILKSITELNKFSLFDPDDVRIEENPSFSSIDMDLETLIAWCNSIGVKTTMKELVTVTRKGAVTGRKFGL